MIFYKKQNKDQNDIFCTIVENENNMTKTARILNISTFTVSSKIKDLQSRLNIKLFDKKSDNTLYLTNEGQKYYDEIKDNPRMFFDKTNNMPNQKQIIQKTTTRLSNIKINALIFKFIKYKKLLLLTTVIIFGCVFAGIKFNENHAFEEDMYENSGPLLKQIIKDGYYRVPEDKTCPLEGLQVHNDIYKMLILLTKSKYKDMVIVHFGMSDEPRLGMRFTGKDELDSIFNDVKYISCRTEESFQILKNHRIDAHNLFIQDRNFRVYALYEKIKDCFHCDYFMDNIKQYPNQLFGIKFEKEFGIPNLRGWIIKNNNYYYIISITKSYLNRNSKKSERYIVYKKLTLEELMSYDNGTYWQLIKNYNIQID